MYSDDEEELDELLREFEIEDVRVDRTDFETLLDEDWDDGQD